jgi:hypothetical protein
MPGIRPIARISPAPWFRHAARLRELEDLLASRVRALECGHDARAPFVHLRRTQIARTCELLEAGRFGVAGAWIERLELEHAHQYLRAADSWDRGQQALAAAPWRVVFSHERARGVTARASLQASTIAHLMYDLPLAIARTGTTASSGARLADAYERLTEAYTLMNDAALRAATARAGRREAPAITAAWQRELRAQAWDDAVALDEGDDRARDVAFKRMELAALCEIRRLVGTRA